MKQSKLSILIVDDEPEARDLLTLLLDRMDGIEITGNAGTVDQAIQQVLRKDPDLILLDIQMPGKNGFELVGALREMKRNTGYIFVTAYDQYAIRALRETAFDYLQKPVDPLELDMAIQRFRNEHKRRIVDDRIEALLRSLQSERRIKLNTRTGFMVINCDDIICCTADGNYTRIVLINDRQETVSSNLGTFETDLPRDQFFRISRSALINLNYISSVDNKRAICKLQGSTALVLKVARKRLATLEKTLGDLGNRQ